MKLPARLRPLAEQIQQNPRLQFGAGLIVAILILWLFMVLGDWRKSRLAVLEATNHRLEQTRNLARQKDWSQRAVEARELAEILDAEIPRAASAGLAQADFQGWLRTIVDTQPPSLRLEVQPPVAMDVPAGFIRVTASLTGSMPPTQILGLISRIESRQSLTTIPMMTVRSDGLNQTFSMTIQAYYKLETGERR